MHASAKILAVIGTSPNINCAANKIPMVAEKVETDLRIALAAGLPAVAACTLEDERKRDSGPVTTIVAIITATVAASDSI